MYKFSAPMPYSIEDINKILDINKEVEKSKITSLYACVPFGCEVFTGFEQSRNFAFDNLNWDYWKRLINHTIDCNCDFIYLLNSPRPLDIENSDFTKQLEKLDLLLTELRKIGVKKLRIASCQLMSYIGKHYNDFDILASTSLEFKTIWEYQNFIASHLELKQIVPSHDVNKNFKLLSILRKRYSNIEIELIVNEGCLQGCQNRVLHHSSKINKNEITTNDICLSGNYITSYCFYILNKFPFHSLAISNVIFPWYLKEYSKIGINHFKFVGRDGYLDNFQYYIYSFHLYLKAIDNMKFIKNSVFSDFFHHLNINTVLNQLTVREYEKYLPKIKYFKKHGHLCASICGIECRYCYKCAEKIQKIFEKKQAELKKINIPVCFIN